jgi:Na+-driven multidrug efflux pump
MHWRGWHSVLIVVVVTAVVLLFAVPADAQCSMCRAALNGSNNARFIRNLNIGVLVLLVPPVTIFCSIFVLLRRYRGNG